MKIYFPKYLKTAKYEKPSMLLWLVFDFEKVPQSSGNQKESIHENISKSIKIYQVDKFFGSKITDSEIRAQWH